MPKPRKTPAASPAPKPEPRPKGKVGGARPNTGGARPGSGRKKRRLTPEEITLVETLAARGLTEVQIKRILRISNAGFIREKKENEVLLNALMTGKAKGVFEIANKLFESAKKGNVPSMIFFLKCRGGEEWREVSTTRMIGGGPDDAPVQLAAIQSLSSEELREAIQFAREQRKRLEGPKNGNARD